MSNLLSVSKTLLSLRPELVIQFESHSLLLVDWFFNRRFVSQTNSDYWIKGECNIVLT